MQGRRYASFAMTPLRSDLIALARKYRALAELRRAEHLESAELVRPSLRALSNEFPGALRELDSLPLEDIEARIDALDRAAGTGGVAEWMRWMLAYHQAMRAALFVKRRLVGRRRVPASEADALARAASHEIGFRCDAAFVSAVAAPPSGRLNTVVFQHLAVTFGVEPLTLGAALFPDPAPHGR